MDFFLHECIIFKKRIKLKKKSENFKVIKSRKILKKNHLKKIILKNFENPEKL